MEIREGQNMHYTINNPDQPIKETRHLGPNFYPPEVIKLHLKKNFALVRPRINRIFFILGQYFVTILAKNYALARYSESKLLCKCNMKNSYRNSNILNSCHGGRSVK